MINIIMATIFTAVNTFIGLVLCSLWFDGYGITFLIVFFISTLLNKWAINKMYDQARGRTRKFDYQPNRRL